MAPPIGIESSRAIGVPAEPAPPVEPPLTPGLVPRFLVAPGEGIVPEESPAALVLAEPAAAPAIALSTTVTAATAAARTNWRRVTSAGSMRDCRGCPTPPGPPATPAP